jgi:hypothetical protein
MTLSAAADSLLVEWHETFVSQANAALEKFVWDATQVAPVCTSTLGHSLRTY